MGVISVLKSKINNNLYIGIKQVQSVLTGSLLAISLLLAPWAATTVKAGDAVKWHPGHYLMLVGNAKNNPYFSKYMSRVYSELDQTPALRGVVVRYTWGEIETAKGVYDFTSIDNLLSALKAKNKRLVILLEKKATAPKLAKIQEIKENLVPAYAKEAMYEGGIYGLTTAHSDTLAGYGVKLWNSNIHERLGLLIQTLGARYNEHTHFEGIGLTESIMGRSIMPFTSAQTDQYYKNQLEINVRLRNNFPNTMVFQYLNFPRKILQSYIDTFKANGIALGNPDVFIEDETLLYKGRKNSPRGVYTYYPENSEIMPLVVQIEEGNFENTKFNGTGYTPTIPELLNFARDYLKVNYLFWTRLPEYNSEVLSILNWKAQISTPSGGLNSVCPSVYHSCVN